MHLLSDRSARAFVGFVAMAAVVLAGCTGSGSSDTDASVESSQPGSDAIVASSATESQGAQSGDGPFVVNMAGGLTTIDPAQACETNDVNFTGILYPRLVQSSTTEMEDGVSRIVPGEVEPWFAESWEVSADGRVYTFKTLEGVTFPSGEPMDAEAVKFSLDRVMETNACGNYFIQDGFLDPMNIESVEAPDATTVVITLGQANPNTLQDLATPAAGIVDPSVVEENGGVEEGVVNKFMATHAAGNGPFLLEEYDPNSRVVLVENPNYFGEMPASSSIQVNFIGDNSTLQLRAESGSADVTMGLSTRAAQSVAESSDARLITNETQAGNFVYFGPDVEAFENVDVRTAMALAIPYESLLEEVALGYGSLFSGPYTPVFPQYDSEIGAPRNFNMEAAQELLAGADVGAIPQLELNLRSGLPKHERIATILQSSWSELGLDVSVRQLTAAEHAGAIDDANFQLLLDEDGPAVIDAGFYLGYAAGCEDAFTGTTVCVPGIDDQIAAARSSSDPEDADAIYDEIAQSWVEFIPRLEIYADDEVILLGPDVESFTFGHRVEMRSWG